MFLPRTSSDEMSPIQSDLRNRSSKQRPTIRYKKDLVLRVSVEGGGELLCEVGIRRGKREQARSLDVGGLLLLLLLLGSGSLSVVEGCERGEVRFNIEAGHLSEVHC